MAGEVLWFVLAFVAFVGLVVAGAILAYRANKRRREALRALAQANGWSFTESDTADRPQRFAGWRPFGQGHSRVAYNVVAGRHGALDFELFGYRYTTTTTDSKGNRHDHVHHNKVLAVSMPVGAPDLQMSRETVGKKLFDALGGSDIDFESDEFSRRFWVKCGDRKFAYDCITPAMMEYLLANPNKWSWRWNGRQLLLVQAGVLQPTDCMATLELVQGFADRIPRILLQPARPR